MSEPHHVTLNDIFLFGITQYIDSNRINATIHEKVAPPRNVPKRPLPPGRIFIRADGTELAINMIGKIRMKRNIIRIAKTFWCSQERSGKR